MENYLKLVWRAKRGDVDAFAQLYAGIYEDMYRFALYTLRNASDAEEAVSDAVTDAFASVKKLRSEEALRAGYFGFYPINARINCVSMRAKMRQGLRIQRRLRVIPDQR